MLIHWTVLEEKKIIFLNLIQYIKINSRYFNDLNVNVRRFMWSLKGIREKFDVCIKI